MQLDILTFDISNLDNLSNRIHSLKLVKSMTLRRKDIRIGK